MRFFKPRTSPAKDSVHLTVNIPIFKRTTIKSSLSINSCLVTSIHHKMNIILSVTTSIKTSNISVPVSTASFMPRISFT